MALLDHELCHAAPSLDDETLDVKYDERGRPVWRVRKHNIEEFTEVVERHGLWKKDLERFAEAIAKKRRMPLLAEAVGATEMKQASV